MSEAQKRFEEAGAKLKGAVAEEKAVAKQEAEKTLAAVRENEELAKAYRDSAQDGAENLGGVSPLLKVHSVGKSQNNQLADGTEPHNGWFFYGPTAEEFQSVECHILTISEGYRAPKLNPKTAGETQFNQLMAGILLVPHDESGGTKTLPFIAYMTGVKLQKMWDFGKEAGKYTRAKPMPIPLFALRVKLTTSQVDSGFGKQWTIDFEIMKNEDGTPIVVSDMGEFTWLKAMVESMKDTTAVIIQKKAVEDDEVVTPLRSAPPVEVVDKSKLTENVESSDIPF